MKQLLSITIPIYKTKADPLEMISLEQSLKILKAYPIIFFAPQEMDASFYKHACLMANVEFKIERFDKNFFTGTNAYNRLMLSPTFYSRFINYKYILIYQLDAFIFKDDLREWMVLDYDYIGAPIYVKQGESIEDSWCVGNGGFSLRKVEAHIRTLKSFGYIKNIPQLFKEIIERKGIKEKLKDLCRLPLNLTIRNNSYYRFNTFHKNEDFFFGDFAPKKFKWFKIPTVKDATKFSIEGMPPTFFNYINNQLPTGCHAWWKHDLPFWKPFIEKFGYIIGYDRNI